MYKKSRCGIKIFFLFLGWITLLTGVGESGCKKTTLEEKVNKTFEAPSSVLFKRANIKVSVQVADSPQERARGLMYRRELDENKGMLFIFENETIHPFWMKNTFIPLDIIFISSKFEIVDVVENAPPLTTKPIVPSVAAKYAVEVNARFARTHGIVVTDRVVFENIEVSPVRSK